MEPVGTPTVLKLAGLDVVGIETPSLSVLSPMPEVFVILYPAKVYLSLAYLSKL